MLLEPTGNSEKSEPQMGFEPTTLHDLVRMPHHLGGWLAASQICFKVTRAIKVMSYAVSRSLTL